MISVIIFFVICIAFCLWNPPYENRWAKIIYWTFCLAAVLIVGFRGEIDNDYATYDEMFRTNWLLVEPTFLVIRFLVRDLLGGNIVGLMLVYALIGIPLKFIAIERYSAFVFPSLLIWIGNLMILQDMTQIRASVACGILLLSIKSLYEKNWKQYFMFVLLATMFHASALLMIPLWFLSGKQINRYTWSGVILVGYTLSLCGIYFTSLLSFIPIDFVQSKIDIYSVEITDDGGANIFGTFQMTRIALFLILLWNVRKIAIFNRYAPLLLKIMACGLAALPLFKNSLVAGLRITELLTCVDILLYPMLLYLIPFRMVGEWIIVGYSAAIIYGRLFIEELLK